MIPILYLFLIIGCYGQEDFFSRARNFSIGLINQTGLDHVAIAPFSVWSLMTGAALWTFEDFQKQISISLILPTNTNSILEEYRNLKRKVLNERSDRIDLDSGMTIFIDKDFDVLSEFKRKMKDYFDAETERLDFNDKNIADIANRYIEIRHPFIINVFNASDFVNASMIMSSVLKFSGYFNKPFGVLNTIEETLHNGDESYYVKMMHQKMKIPYSNMDSMNANIMELALGQQGKFSLLLLFPHKNKTLQEVYNNFNKVTLVDIFDKLESDVKESGLKEMDVKLPRLRIVTNIVLNKQLSDIGLSDVFASDDTKFTGITDEDIYITSVDHYTEFVIFESGVYVVSRTPGYYGYLYEASKFDAEEPFIYFVVEKTTKTILIGGFYSKARYV